jgi:hypothetical protein
MIKTIAQEDIDGAIEITSISMDAYTNLIELTLLLTANGDFIYRASFTGVKAEPEDGETLEDEKGVLEYLLEKSFVRIDEDDDREQSYVWDELLVKHGYDEANFNLYWSPRLTLEEDHPACGYFVDVQPLMDKPYITSLADFFGDDYLNPEQMLAEVEPNYEGIDDEILVKAVLKHDWLKIEVAA